MTILKSLNPINQTACLEEQKFYKYFQDPLLKITRLCTCYSPQNNLLLISKDKFARNTLRAPINSNSIFFIIPVSFCAFIFAFALGLSKLYTNVDLERAIKLALKLFIKGQKYSQVNSALQNRVFKA